MKKILTYIAIFLGTILLLILIAGGIFLYNKSSQSKANMALLGVEAPTLTQDGITFRDLNKNGALEA